jgi:hypothetical protein
MRYPHPCREALPTNIPQRKENVVSRLLDREEIPGHVPVSKNFTRDLEIPTPDQPGSTQATVNLSCGDNSIAHLGIVALYRGEL